MSFQPSSLQSIAVGKCVVWGLKKCWEWTKNEERTHREIEKLERLKESVIEQLMIFKQQEQEKIRKEKEAINDDDDDVLEILKNINIDDIIKEFQIKNNN